MNERVFCDQCAWHGSLANTLRDRNPFDRRLDILGCPDCKSIDSMVTACDEPGCWNQTTCGTRTPTGYRRTCSEHRPKV